MFKKVIAILFFQLLIFSLAIISNAQGLPVTKPEKVHMSSEKLNQIDGLVNQAIAEKKMPGAVVLVGRKGKIVFRKAYGKRSLVPMVEDMTVDTIFDLASLTKPIATATSIMILVEQGKLRLNDTVGKFIPEIEDENAKKVTIKQLLTHTSGYRPDFDLGEKWSGRDGMLQALKKEKLRNPPGTKFVYSDIGFIVLAEIVGRVKGKITKEVRRSYKRLKGEFVADIKDYSIENIFSSMKMNSTTFSEQKKQVNLFLLLREKRIAPTENFKGQQNYLGSRFDGTEEEGNRILRGEVHDPTAYRMNGIAGHAGLFSTADDLARYCQMLLNGGILNGKRVLSAATVAKMTKPYVVSEKGDKRGLGWDINTRFSSNRGELFPLGSFGHTGFTGTGIWIDSLSKTFVIFLSNRVHPDGKGSIVEVRAKISTVVASAITDVSLKQIKDFEARYQQQVAVGIEQFKQEKQIAEKNFISQLPLGNFKKDISNLLPYPSAVLNGIDVLQRNKFAELNGLKVGLVTNHTGSNFAGKSTIDILNEAEKVQLVSLFSPEHGIRGKLDQAKINDSLDEKTGLPIYSLYGKSRRPKPEQLKNLDALVFDIQDIGTRFYTYISTLRYVLEEAAKANKKVFVLDRPNPINGIDVAGSIADVDKLTFVATHTLPIRHGMTIGEIALMMNKERNINANLEIIKMQNWKRSMWFDEIKQIWINPSPNMRNLTQATLYPGIGLLETTNLSVGRGTDTPFEIIGSPWIENQKLSSFLNTKNLKGVRFVPISFTPKSSVFKGEKCNGINIIITNRNTFEPIKTGLVISLTLRELYPNKWEMKNYNRLLVSQKTLEMVKEKKTFEEIQNSWKRDLAEFKKRRKNFLLY